MLAKGLQTQFILHFLLDNFHDFIQLNIHAHDEQRKTQTHPHTNIDKEILVDFDSANHHLQFDVLISFIIFIGMIFIKVIVVENWCKMTIHIENSNQVGHLTLNLQSHDLYE